MLTMFISVAHPLTLIVAIVFHYIALHVVMYIYIYIYIHIHAYIHT